MKILKFKTNISTQEQIALITPILDQVEGISKWDIDPDSNDNILSVSGENLNPQKVENVIQKAGFKVEVLRILGIAGESL
ncbi:copper chaperone (plasmid) [Adhaeribacter radiodurans]|uniref:Copper chaperone n=2 Tax=Adhaeribacter radiodurans TaxID=2745197 RepID=A0A7L7L1F1_9BACT|nr:copper chaperone [Adhaeribacter radiodurans]